MKTIRQSLILDIIKNKEIETQEELARELIDSGVNITQATISRDIKDLNLIKVQTENGKYKYAASAGSMGGKNISVLMRVFKSTVKSIMTASNMVVVKTLAGSGNAAAEVIDNLDIDGIVGTIAGDNTIFLATNSEQAAHEICNQLLQMI
jgi:transcriptional regulator of arginine metabolism